MALTFPSPHDCGLPDKFDAWRQKQIDALQLIQINKKRVTGINVPTGGGKSAIAVGAALRSKLPTCIVTNSRGLQKQYMRDFESIGMVSIMGRSNYKCDMRNDYTCEDGYVARCPYKGSVGCPSSLAEMRAASSNLVTTNYAKWTSSRKYGTGMSHFQHVIFDEGHDAYGALANAMQITLNHKEVEETLHIPFPHDTEEMMSWKSWASTSRIFAEDALQEAKARITGVSDARASWIRHYTHMRNLCKRLDVLRTCNAKEWIADKTDKGYVFDPIRPGRYSESALLLGVPKILVLSATLRPKSLFMIGIGRDNFEFKEYDSDFDPKRCPIYYVPTMRVDKNHTDLRQLWVLFDQIAGSRKDRNGICHTISYARRDDIVANSRFAPSMLINQKGEAPASMIEDFIQDYPGKILVSPSVGTGYDFPFKAAEWQFLTKIPFPDSRSKIVRARQEDDKEYGPHIAMQYMVQAFGRIMRDKADQGENFIGDTHLDWFLPRYAHLAPRSFHGFFRKVDYVPRPPERLQ